MLKTALGAFAFLLLFANKAMATCSSYPYTLTNGTTADASQLMADLNCAVLSQGATIDNASFTTSASFLSPIALVRADTSHAASVNFRTGATSFWSVGMDPVSGAAGDLMFYNVTQSATQMLLKSNGVTGIGTDSPAGVFEVRKSQNATSEFYFTNNDSTNTNTRSALDLVAGTRSLQFVAIHSDNEYINYTAGTSLYLDEGSSPRMVLVSGGNVGIGTTSPGYLLTVNGTAYATGAAGALSDIRHKSNVISLRDGALQDVMRLRPVSFTWKLPKDDGMDGRQMGFIAQEVEKVLPSTVLTEHNREKTKGLKYNELIALLTKALQEQQTEISTLKAANDREQIESAEVFSRLKALERRISVRTASK